MKTKTTPKQPKKSLYPKNLFIEIYDDEFTKDTLVSFTAEDVMEYEDKDEISVAIYEFKKMVTIRREKKITVTGD